MVHTHKIIGSTPMIRNSLPFAEKFRMKEGNCYNQN
nr:MAG TPA: hypothetical protein [Caudoviricetes sp.]